MPNVWGFFPPAPVISPTLDTTGALQFNSDSVTEVGTDPTGEGFNPARVSPLQTSARVQGLLGLLTNQL